METRVEKGLPIDWRERIQGKKVIFYNTSISNLLNGGDKHIAKIAQVLETFRTQRDVVLWWRPHPLELFTVESMRPDLARKYTAIRKQYEEEGWGILDTSADVHRAIAASDAYYGDWSSLIHMYRVTGKPILLSKDSIMKYEIEPSYSVEDFIIIDDCMWFISASYNALFRMELNSFVINEMIEISEKGIHEQDTFKFLLQEGRMLILIPGWGEDVVIFDIDRKEIRKFNVGKRTAYSKVSKAYINKGVLYLFMSMKDEILRIDIGSLNPSFEKITLLEVEDIVQINSDRGLQVNLSEEQEEDETNVIYTCQKRVDEKVYLFLYQDNMWKIIDMKTNQVLRKKIEVIVPVKEKMLSILYSEVCGEDSWTYSLPNFIDAIKQQGLSVDEKIQECGKCIHDICKR